MISEDRVKIMSKMSLYENKLGQEDMKINSYYKKDYSSFNTLITALWITVGYVILVALLVVSNLDALMKSLNTTKLIALAGIVIGGYLVLLIAYCIGTSNFYKKRHNRAKRRLKAYYRGLTRLKKLYMKEKR